jgi:hypothetical protein
MSVLKIKRPRGLPNLLLIETDGCGVYIQAQDDGTVTVCISAYGSSMSKTGREFMVTDVPGCPHGRAEGASVRVIPCPS